MATAPDFSALDRGAVVRWTAALKEELVRRYEAGEIGLGDLLRRHSLSLDEFDGWRRRLRKGGRAALKVKRPARCQRGLFG